MSGSRSKPSNPAKNAPTASSSGSPTSSSSASTASSRLPPHIDEMRRKVFVEPQSAVNTASVLSPDAYAAYGVNTALTVDDFSRAFSIEVIQLTKDRMIFDMVGCEAPLANALRRILLAEVPSMAIEKCVIFQNTSIVQDEVLAHRLGLLPLRADPRLFSTLAASDYVPNESNTLVFTLDVTCTRTANTSDTAVNDEKYTNSLVTTADIKWQPQGRQAQRLTGAAAVGLHYDDIVVAKMRPGQSIQVEMHAEKGIGAQHAKWSPVSTASYRMLPEINIVQETTGEKARELVKKCPMNVFDIEEVGGGVERAVVSRPRNCTMCRECIRGDDWNERVNLRRVRNHFVFSVETTGAYSPADVVKEGIKILRGKGERVRKEMEKVGQEEETGQDEDEDVEG